MNIQKAIDLEITRLLEFAADILEEQNRRCDWVYGSITLEVVNLQLASYKRLEQDLQKDDNK
jgi:hypothetical protein